MLRPVVPSGTAAQDQVLDLGRVDAGALDRSATAKAASSGPG
jgi:hypothetical protein